MKRLTALAFVVAALGCTDGDKKTPAAETPAAEPAAPGAATAPGEAEPGAGISTAEPASQEPGQLLAVGQAAPNFETVAHDGTAISMKALRGQPVVLYFYPADATPG